MDEDGALATAQSGDTVQMFAGCGSVLVGGSCVRADIGVFVIGEVEKMSWSGGGCYGVVVALLRINTGEDGVTLVVVKSNKEADVVGVFQKGDSGFSETVKNCGSGNDDRLAAFDGPDA